MKLTVLPDATTAAQAAADLVAGVVQRKANAVLGLATGGTMEPVYAALAGHHRTGLSLAQIRSFNLDEYLGLPADHPRSYHHYMAQHLFDLTDIDRTRTHLPDGMAEPNAEASRYETLITQHGPIDLQLLGLGGNGHIGFNEPDSAFDSTTRAVDLADSTRNSNKRFFDDGDLPPERALTMGIATILKARQIVLLATGDSKARAVAAMVNGPITETVPGSVLQRHADVTVLLDDQAAALL
ncbi:MAG: glucosamine-6-phosphate deaminase [Pelagimonas sp.]|jgi:glucosamine-6-phosphate deaminase|nr:glucosamine-6-phosphate deaminase [Pelagimonas sp.]